MYCAHEINSEVQTLATSNAVIASFPGSIPQVFFTYIQSANGNWEWTSQHLSWLLKYVQQVASDLSYGFILKVGEVGELSEIL